MSGLSPKPSILVIDRPLGAEPFTVEDIKRLRPIAQHLAQALELSHQFHALNNALSAYQQQAATLRKGVLLLAADGKILFANAFAEQLLAAQLDLTVANGRLSGITADARHRIKQLLMLAKLGRGSELSLKRTAPYRTLTLHTLVRDPNHDVNGLPNQSQGQLVVILSEAEERNPLLIQAQTYRLSTQELKIWQMLVEGSDLKTIAETHQVSINTVRTQLASIFQKTDCKRQKDLVRLYFTLQNNA